jgi:CheY-like chemotaxis protein
MKELIVLELKKDSIPFLTYYKSLKRLPESLVKSHPFYISPRPMKTDDLFLFIGKYKDFVSKKEIKKIKGPKDVKRIYICEDSSMLREYFSFVIEEYFESQKKLDSLRLCTFPTGEELIEHSKSGPPDIIFSDVNLDSAGGTLTGIDIIESMKKINPSCHLFILSNHDKLEMSDVVLNKGADQYFELPVEKEDILGIFENLNVLVKGR